MLGSAWRAWKEFLDRFGRVDVRAARLQNCLLTQEQDAAIETKEGKSFSEMEDRRYRSNSSIFGFNGLQRLFKLDNVGRFTCISTSWVFKSDYRGSLDVRY